MFLCFNLCLLLKVHLVNWSFRKRWPYRSVFQLLVRVSSSKVSLAKWSLIRRWSYQSVFQCFYVFQSLSSLPKFPLVKWRFIKQWKSLWQSGVWSGGDHTDHIRDWESPIVGPSKNDGMSGLRTDGCWLDLLRTFGRTDLLLNRRAGRWQWQLVR